MYDRMLEQTNWYFSWKEYTVHLLFQKWQKSEDNVLWWYIFVFLVCSISAERYTGTTIEQDTQQAVPCDTHCDSNQYPLITVLYVLAQLMIFVHTQHTCYILLQWK